MSKLGKIARKKWNERKKKKLRNKIVNLHHDVSEYDVSKLADLRKQGFSFSESAILDLKKNDWHDYISTWEGYQPRLIENKYFMISDDKYLFSLVFGNYVKVAKNLCLINKGQLVPCSPEIVNIDELLDWALKHGGCVIKDRSGCDGFNVFVIRLVDGKLMYHDEIVDRKKMEDIIKQLSNGLVQERLEQGQYASKIFPDSVNTLRIISMKKADESRHEIAAAVQRIGTKQSAPVDNFNQGGLSAIVDIETGKVGKATGITMVDENGQRLFCSNHPDTGSQIEGLTVPDWQSIKQAIGNVSERLPFFDYVAWDIAMQDNGFAVIETNMKSTLNLLQIHGGLRNSHLGDMYRERGFLVDDHLFK